jgi:hypothetical protein
MQQIGSGQTIQHAQPDTPLARLTGLLAEMGARFRRETVGEYGTDVIVLPTPGDGDEGTHVKFEFDEDGNYLAVATWTDQSVKARRRESR